MDYAQFFDGLLTREDLARITEENKLNLLDNISDLRLEWLSMLKERPYSAAELYDSIPPELQAVKPYLPVFAIDAVAEVFKGYDVAVRYQLPALNNENTTFYGLPSIVDKISGAAIKTS